MIEIVLMILSHVPVVDLLSHGVSAEPLPFLYDIGQAVGALQLIAQGAVKLSKAMVELSEATPWTWDDGPAKAAAGYTTTALEYITDAMEWLARIGGALQKK